MKHDMEQRWIKAVPDHKAPNSQTKVPKFKHVFAKNPAYGCDRGVVSYRDYFTTYTMHQSRVRIYRADAGNLQRQAFQANLQRKAVQNAALMGYRY